MTHRIEEKQLISHAVAVEDLDTIIQTISTRIKQGKFKFYTTKKRQLDLLQQMSQFNFGRFLLQNKGLNGYWTHYVLTYPWFGKKTGLSDQGSPLSRLEKFILDHPMRATQERFQVFLKENQTQVKNNAKLACIPCGMMGELLYLDFNGLENIDLIGIDYDVNTLNDAQRLAVEKGLSHCTTLKQCNAWKLNIHNEYDLISSNGLNIYESDHTKVSALYKQFYDALKPSGKLVTSFLTYPPFAGGPCEWNVFKLNLNNLFLQKILFFDILQVKWQCYRTTTQRKVMLESIGFQNIRFIYDEMRMFPTVVAYK